jgi:metallophosphoesterase (TIGR00282 family)
VIILRILYLGDIVGEKTIDILKVNLETIKKENHIHLVLCNAENVTKGRGLSYQHYKELKALGIAGMSMGNHTFSKSEIKEYIEEATIARPANLSTDIGKNVLYIQYNQEVIALVNLMGRVYMNSPLDCPFKTFEALYPTIQADHILVDFHGEATSEKKAFFYNFAGKIDAVLGTHTHVKTDDKEVFMNTCYISDLGMCGPKYSVLGSDVIGIIERFKTGIYEPTKLSNDKEYILNGVILDLGKTNKIEDFKKTIPATIL